MAKIDEGELVAIITEAVSTELLAKMPYDAQDDLDPVLAEHFMLRTIMSKVNSRLEKMEDTIKERFRDGASPVDMSKNYRRELSLGTPRNSLDLEGFIDAICAKYPGVLKHNLRALVTENQKQSKAPVMIKLEYVGDIDRRD